MIHPPDIEEANQLWHANCGPCSVAAILNLPVNGVRELFDGFEHRGYANITHIKDALDRAGVNYYNAGAGLPKHGLAFIQWGGHEGKPQKVQYRYTHWIAIKGDIVFDVNAPHLTTLESWKDVMPQAIQEEGFGNGTFSVRAGIEIIEEKY